MREAGAARKERRISRLNRGEELLRRSEAGEYHYKLNLRDHEAAQS
jgi:hypothetical protein